jgi:arylsulfatase A-like enzyme
MGSERRARRGQAPLGSALAAALLVFAPGCAPGDAAPRSVGVVGRLGAAEVRTSIPLVPAPLRLAGQLRRAVCADSDFAISLEQPVHRVQLALGLQPEGGSARFRVRRGGPGAARTLLDEHLEVREAAWQSHRLDLDPPLAPGHALEFSAEASDGARPCWGSVLFLGPDAPGISRPDVILISLDTLGASQVGALGGIEGATPELDAFLARSFVFSRAYAQYPGTYTSHTSLFSGLYPVRHGRYAGRGAALQSLVEAFAAQGYLTAAFAEDAYVGSAFGFGRGFDLYDDGPARGFEAVSGNAAQTFARAEQWLRHFGEGVRFLLFVHTYEVHAPYVVAGDAERRFADSLTPDDLRHFDAHQVASRIRRHNDGSSPLSVRDRRRLWALHAGEVRRLDSVVGGFLRRMEKRGTDPGTLLAVTSDHGEEFGEQGKMGHGRTLSEAVLRVPLAIAWPGTIAPGRSDDPVALVDLLPTLLDLAGLPVPSGLDGRSLAARVAAVEAAGSDRPVFAELQDTREECRAWRGPGPCRLGRYAVWTRRFKYVSSRHPPSERLHDLESDPDEQRDVSARHPAALAQHRAWLEAYLSEETARVGEPSPVDAETRDRLRALGYVD